MRRCSVFQHVNHRRKPSRGRPPPTLGRLAEAVAAALTGLVRVRVALQLRDVALPSGMRDPAPPVVQFTAAPVAAVM